MSGRLILASKSASRQAMLRDADVRYEAIPADVDEIAIKDSMLADGADSAGIALALAEAKALAISTLHPDRLVLGSDSIVSAGGRLFDKPVSRDDAAAHLRLFSGNPMRLDSAVALMRGGQTCHRISDHALLHVRTLSEAFIATYLDAEWPAISGCVGCFRIEARGVHLFEKTEGSHFTILGMPLLPVLAALRAEGILAA
jgi:septum formation protein